jgi:hypothetical protein
LRKPLISITDPQVSFLYLAQLLPHAELAMIFFVVTVGLFFGEEFSGAVLATERA